MNFIKTNLIDFLSARLPSEVYSNPADLFRRQLVGQGRNMWQHMTVVVDHVVDFEPCDGDMRKSTKRQLSISKYTKTTTTPYN